MTDDADNLVEWHPPRGPLTKIAAWLILAALALCLMLMIVGAVLLAA